MGRPCRYIASLFLLFCNVLAFSQVGEDTVKANFAPKSIRVGTDLSLIGRSLSDKDLTAFEVNMDTELYRYLISLDYGFQKLTSTGNDFDYEHDGSYYRLGLDANFNYSDGFESVLFLGIRYAASSFDETLQYSINDPVFGASTELVTNSGVKARWFEAVAGLKVNVFGQVYLGFTGRLKFAKKIKSPTNFTSFKIPGYGPTAESSINAINYHVFYKIPFGKR